MTESEIWKDVAGYEGFYKVSNEGNVYSVGRKDPLGRNHRGRTLAPGYDKGGYLIVSLCKNGKLKTKTVHRLVAETFLPNPNGYSEINHRDENKVNNYANNLEWCTREHNVNHGTMIERSAQTRSKKVKAINIKTGEVLTFNSLTEAGRKGYHCGVVSMACRGVYKGRAGKLVGGDGRTYKGYRWSYEEANHETSRH